MTRVNYISDNQPDGTCFGQSASEKISFHGATPCDQAAVSAAVVATAVLISTGKAGFTSTTSAKAIVTAVNALLTMAKEKGLMASA